MHWRQIQSNEMHCWRRFDQFAGIHVEKITSHQKLWPIIARRIVFFSFDFVPPNFCVIWNSGHKGIFQVSEIIVRWVYHSHVHSHSFIRFVATQSAVGFNKIKIVYWELSAAHHFYFILSKPTIFDNFAV